MARMSVSEILKKCSEFKKKEERVEALRKAFLQALADPDLLAEGAKQQLVVNPLSGEALDRMIRDLYATPPDIVEKARIFAEQ